RACRAAYVSRLWRTRRQAARRLLPPGRRDRGDPVREAAPGRLLGARSLGFTRDSPNFRESRPTPTVRPAPATTSRPYETSADEGLRGGRLEEAHPDHRSPRTTWPRRGEWSSRGADAVRRAGRTVPRGLAHPLAAKPPWRAPLRPRPRRVLITGGAGFIGTNLAHRLLL